VKIDAFMDKVGDAFIDINNGVVSDAGASLAFTIQESSFYCRRLSTAQIGIIIALAASCLDEDEAYVNIGVWDGFSLFAATLGAPNATSIGVDNFSEMHQQQQPLLNPDLDRDYGDTRANFYRALKHCGNPKTRFHEMDWHDFINNASLFPTGKLGAVYYDGEHTEQAHTEFFHAVLPHLSSECVLFIDDTRIDFVRHSIDEFIAANPDFKILIDVGGKRRRDPAWWGGFVVVGRHARNQQT
jgi:hypothetical protein